MNYIAVLGCAVCLLMLLLMILLLKKGKGRIGVSPVRELPQPVNKRTDYFENFIRSYNGAAEDTREDVESIWARIKVLLDPNRSSGNDDDATGVIECIPTLMNSPDGCGRVSGLVVGRVQSGKTRNYVGLLLKAFDEGWNTVIVLTSNNKMLALQTWNRLLGNGVGEGDIFNRGKAHVTPMTKFDRSATGEIEFVWRLSDGEWRDGELYVGIVQKEDAHLERFKKWLETVRNVGHLEKMRVLVIDDEADNATPDSSLGARDVAVGDDEVLAIADQLDQDCSIVKADAVANWVRSLTTLDLSACTEQVRNAVRDFLRQNPNPYGNISGFKSSVLNNNIIRDLLGLDENVDGQPLSDVVASVFNGRKTRGNPIRNAKSFVTLVLYALEFAPNRSTINRYICNIFSKVDSAVDFAWQFKNVAYVGYTATPYANLLNEDPLKNPISADFIKPLKTPKSYIGLERIYGVDGQDRLDVVRNIPDEDDVGAIQPLVEFNWEDSNDNTDSNGQILNQPSVSEDLVVTNSQGDSREWASMKQAVAWLYCAASVRRVFRLRKNSDDRAARWTTMIINVSHEISVHRKLRDCLKAYISYLREEDVRVDFLRMCNDLWTSETMRLSPEHFMAQSSGAFAEVFHEGGEWYPEWGEVERGIQWFLDNPGRIHVIEINSTPEGKRWQSEYVTAMANGVVLRDDHVWIVCGGNTISRGLTLDGLVVSYFDRISDQSCVDTITQMGRWFGYRVGYELLPRIWMTQAADREMMNIAAIENALHRELGRKFDQGNSPKNPQEFAGVKYLGRRLTGRDSAMEVIGRGGHSDYFGNVYINGSDQMEVKVQKWLDNGHRNRLNLREDAEYSWQHVTGLRSCPYYRNIPADQLVGLLSDLKQHYEDADQMAIGNLISAMHSAGGCWDLAIENPGRLRDGREANNVIGVAYSRLHVNPVGEVLRLKTQSYRAWFVDVKNKYINTAECNLAEVYARGIGQHDSAAVMSEVMAVRQGKRDRLSHDLRRTIGIDKGSSESYRAAVFAAAGKVTPVLHLTLAKVSTAGESYNVVLMAYYWPSHHVDAVAMPRVGRHGGGNDGRYRASDAEVADAVRRLVERDRVVSIDSVKRELKDAVGAIEPTNAQVLRGVESCSDICSLLDVDNSEMILRDRQVIYAISGAEGGDALASVRNMLAAKIADKFRAELNVRNSILDMKRVYDYLREEVLPGGICKNEVFRSLWQNPWRDVLMRNGISSMI